MSPPYTDMFKPNGWGNRNDVEGGNWLHNDFRQMAYLYNFMLFNKIVAIGDLKNE